MKRFLCAQTVTVEESRTIYPSVYHDYYQLSNFVLKQNSNRLKTTKYNVLTFIPLNLFEQFKRFANVYFIAIVCLNFVPQINAFGKEMAPLPILFVLILTAVKDAVEDLRRWQSDRKVNHMPCLLYNSNTGSYEVAHWEDICPGDFVKIGANEPIPADILVFRSSEWAGNCFIETSNLDGEINLKQREVVHDPLQRHCCITAASFATSTIVVESPNKEIYKFNGKWVFDDDSPAVTLKKANLILRGCILRNTEFVEGIVIYTGNETKSLLNNNKLTFKRSKLEEQINRDVIWCVGILTILCLACSIGHAVWLIGFPDISTVVFFSFSPDSDPNPYLQGFFLFWTSLIIFQTIIPLPLYVTIELVKLHQVFHITRDLKLYDEKADKRIQVKATNITEDLGQIQYVFCDKTGTLTENLMEFKRATIGYIDFYDDSCVPLGSDSQSLGNIIKLLQGRSQRKIDLDENLDASFIEEFVLVLAVCNTTMVSQNKNQSKIIVEIPTKHNSSFFKIASNPQQNRAGNQKRSRRFSSGLNLKMFGIDDINLPSPPPHISIEENVSIPKNLKVPEQPDPAADDSRSMCSDTSQFKKSSISKLNHYNYTEECPYDNETLYKFYESESPDEVALVKTACQMGIKLLQRGPGFVCIWKDYHRKAFELTVLCVLPFDSDRKRMSVIMMDPETGAISLYCKGADSAILPVLSRETSFHMIQKVSENVEYYSKMGLRTLLVAKKTLKEKAFFDWHSRFRDVELTLTNNDSELLRLYNEIESDLVLLGATGIEDKLQEQVPECLETLRRAGMNVWVLTGDKMETAINIAYSAKLFNENQEILRLTGNNQETVLKNLSIFCRQISKQKSLNASSSKSKEIIDEYGLVMDGETLSVILDEDIMIRKFITLASCCNSVVCCRSTPTQKAAVVSLVKNNLHVRTLAIGDGANDVCMIQTAHVGIGIGGKEGMQAVLASDFAITKFKYLRRLLLVHGHRCYDQLARMSLYMFYKDTIIVLVLFWFQTLNGFSGSAAIDQISQTLFNLTMTGLPPLILGIWDKDFQDDILENNPQIYKSGIHLKSYRPRDFWRNIVDSIWQSLVIVWLTYFCYAGTEIGMGEYGILCNTALLITTYSQMLLESRFWGPFHWISCIGSLLVAWYAEVFILNSICVVVLDCNTDNPYKVIHRTMSQPKTYLVVVVVTAVALFPRVLIKAILLTIRPSIIYEAQRRIKAKTRSERSIVDLGDLESCKKADEDSSNIIFDNFRFRSKKDDRESMTFTFLKKSKVEPFPELVHHKSIDMIL